jgi:hypothetical protein
MSASPTANEYTMYTVCMFIIVCCIVCCFNKFWYCVGYAALDAVLSRPDPMLGDHIAEQVDTHILLEANYVLVYLTVF